MSIAYTAETTVTIKRDDQRLAEVDAAISECYAAITAITTGSAQEYTIFGSRMVKRADLGSIRETIETLNRERSRLERRILRAKGWTGRNHADFSGGGSNEDPGDVDV